MFGPLLRYIDTRNNTWIGSLLIGFDIDEGVHDPVARVKSCVVHGERVYSNKGVEFWRFILHVPMDRWQVSNTYSIRQQNKVFYIGSFFVPGVYDNWNIAFFSCNGFEKPAPGDCISETWMHMLRRHRERPINLLIGGGDQGYFDGVTEIPCVKEAIIKYRDNVPLDSVTLEAIDDYFLNAYIDHFSVKGFEAALAKMPYMFVWDDHDVIDGWGSYEDAFLDSPVGRAIYGAARKYYFLFQQHCRSHDDTADCEAMGLLPTCPAPANSTKREHHMITRAGPRLMVATIDNRSARTLETVTTPQGYDTFFDELERTLRAQRGKFDHLMLVLAIPIGGYPPLRTMETVLKLLNPIVRILRLGDGYTGDIDLIDDIMDRWDASTHVKERAILLRRLVNLAKEFRIRITILSGDVHCGGFGAMHRWTPQGFVRPEAPESMMQVISSPIGNHPAPAPLISMYNLGRLPKRQGADHSLGVRLDTGDVRGLVAKRNWCELRVDKNAKLQATLHIENAPDTSRVWTRYTVPIPKICETK